MPEPVNENAAPGPAAAEAPERPPIVEAGADLVQLVIDFARQETGDLVRDKIVIPGQQLGQVLAFAIAAAQVLFLGLAFIAVAALLVLAELIGWPAALFVIGGILMMGAGLFTYLKTRSLQR